VRLGAIAAQTSQAAFAVNTPEGGCASGPFLSSAMTCSASLGVLAAMGAVLR
jgi:hypothetical protein